MSKMTEEFNEKAMEIILHAGEGQNFLNEAIIALTNDRGNDEVNAILEEAKKEITKAHVIQTEVIQTNIGQEEYITTLLFTHAQDTLMTITSEMNMVKNMVQLYRKLKGVINER